LKIRKGDLVKIISGKDRGREGRVALVLPKVERIVVEKINVVKKHKRQTDDQKDPGGIVEVEAPIHVSNVMVVCKSCNKPSRVGCKIKQNKKVRICKKCKKSLD
jgi:large subunit ribosomal protein L24